jgi:hypothetical protein
MKNCYRCRKPLDDKMKIGIKVWAIANTPAHVEVHPKCLIIKAEDVRKAA